MFQAPCGRKKELRVSMRPEVLGLRNQWPPLRSRCYFKWCQDTWTQVIFYLATACAFLRMEQPEDSWEKEELWGFSTSHCPGTSYALEILPFDQEPSHWTTKVEEPQETTQVSLFHNTTKGSFLERVDGSYKLVKSNEKHSGCCGQPGNIVSHTRATGGTCWSLNI